MHKTLANKEAGHILSLSTRCVRGPEAPPSTCRIDENEIVRDKELAIAL